MNANKSSFERRKNVEVNQLTQLQYVRVPAALLLVQPESR